jgi:hemerythrin-like domain-containing protein
LTAIDELTREHDHVVNLIGDVRAAVTAGDLPRVVQLARAIAAVLGPHTEVEEHGLFPALAGDFPDHVTALRDEHRHIEAVLAEAANPDHTWPARLVDTLDVLREHILKEQDGVFPAALTTLRTEDWEVVDTIRSRAGGQLPISA